MIIYQELSYTEKQLYMKAAMRALYHWQKIKEACEELNMPYGSVLNWVSITKRMMIKDRFERLENYYLPIIEKQTEESEYFPKFLEMDFARRKEEIRE